jgi:cytosine deaminase
MDLVLANAALRDGATVHVADVGIHAGRVVEIGSGLAGEQRMDLAGRLAVPGFVETHIHLDKACILERCSAEEGTLAEAIGEVSRAKRDFTVEDIRARAASVIERCIGQGTTRMRAHLEVDPVIGVKSIEAVLPLVDDYAWAVDLEICVFPQEGLLNNPGTDELMVDALRGGARVVGGCPYTDTDPHGQIDRVFELAREFDVDVDFHLDFDTEPSGMTAGYVCEVTERAGWGGRVAIGHVSKLSALDSPALRDIGTRLADTGVAVTVLPSTDLFLMGAGRDHDVVRGVAPVHRLLELGVNCTLATNNVLNPFTPFGDCSLVRMANLYANIAQLGTRAGWRECLSMVTDRAGRLLRASDYGIAPGGPADLVVLDCETPEAAVQTLAPPLYGFKRGRRTFTREPVELHRP